MQMLIVSALQEKLDEVNDFLRENLSALGCPKRTLLQIEMAVEEVFVNIASYAYPSGCGNVQFELESCPNGVIITISDEGIPFDPLQKPDADVTLSAEEREIGGLGIFLVKQTMDEVRYHNVEGKNVLQIKKLFC